MSCLVIIFYLLIHMVIPAANVYYSAATTAAATADTTASTTAGKWNNKALVLRMNELFKLEPDCLSMGSDFQA